MTKQFLRLSLCFLLSLSGVARGADALVSGWDNPPTDARLRAYWWWLNGNVTKESITHDLEEMKAKGFGGAVIVDAGGAEQGGNDRVPHGPTFFSPEWRELYKHTLREADRCGLIISLNIQSGWNLGGPMVTPDDAAKKLTWSETIISGPTNFNQPLPQPEARDNFYRDVKVVAYRIRPDQPAHPPLENWQEKALYKNLLSFSAPVTTPLFQEIPATVGEADATTGDVLDLSASLNTNGTLNWNAPAGKWQVLRFGFTIGDRARVSTYSEGWKGYAIDVFDAGAFQRYWDAIVEPLIADAGPLAGKTLKYLHTDSWEIEPVNWTPTLPREFARRRGYDLTPWLPVLAGRIVNDRESSDRFLFDFRKTLGDLTVDNHYAPFRDNAHRHGLQIHPESGGPHGVPIDAQRCLGMDDAPMSEFWAWSWEHRIGDENRFFVKQPASAAHTYGHPQILAEGFTDLGPHWQESIWSNLKPSFDKALCEGMNVLVWHAFVCSPDSTGFPGQQYFAGTHFNPKVTWWQKSGPFLDYINRSEWLMQQGRFVADVVYYYGDHVPNFTQLKDSDPAGILPGYDYDVITEEALLTRATVRDKQIVLPDGMTYRMLVLPNRETISLPVLQKLREFARAGATIIGPKPVKGETLQDFPQCDQTISRLADELWDAKEPILGRVIAGKSARAILAADGVAPDCEFITAPEASFDYIHRRDGDTEIYFVANRTNTAATARVAFRVAGKAPELWNAVTGAHEFVTAYEEKNGRTFIPLDFTPCGSWFVIFREPASAHPPVPEKKSAPEVLVQEISGGWTVHFDPKWGGPGTVSFRRLVDWTTRREPGIKFYSGTAVYETTFNLRDLKTDSANTRQWLDLGDVHELAEVRLNGAACGITWCPPFRVEVTGKLKPGVNKLEIEVVNFWPNRLIGDQSLPKASRFTRTNIRAFTEKTPLMPSGLLGPVQLRAAGEVK